MSLIEKSACELLELQSDRKVSAKEIATAFCDRIEAVEPRIKAFLHFDREKVITQAQAVDQKRDAGQKTGKLAGIPIAIKDILCSVGEQATCASKILEPFRSPYDAHVIRRFKEEDAILIGRTNMDEFAMGSSTENSAFQKTKNPWDLERVPGGSSGGSAAAVAALEAPFSIGTDTGGSIRQPASLCGIVGMKPTYGRVSRYGLIAFASSLDQIGPFARTAKDTALIMDVLADYDSKDSTCANVEKPNYLEECTKPIEGLRVGVVAEHFGQGLEPEVDKAVREAISVLKSKGAKISDVRLPSSPYGIAAYYIVATAEASSNLARFDGIHYGHRAAKFTDLIDLYSSSRGEGFGAEVKRRIMLGTYVLSAGYREAFYVKALKVRRVIRNEYDAAFKDVDVILGPTTPGGAFKIGEKASDPLAMYLNDIYTVGANLAGLPGISLPCGFTSSGLPIGLHLQAPAFGESTLLRVSQMYQSETDWHTRTAAI